jgi:hypothetical protein
MKCWIGVTGLFLLSNSIVAPGTTRADPFRQVEPGSPEARKLEEERRRPQNTQDLLKQRLPELKLENNQLEEVIHFLRDVAAANVHVNWNALKEVGVKRGSLVTLRVRDVPFGEALSAVLAAAQPAGGAVIDAHYEVIYISTRQDLDILRDFKARHDSRRFPDAERAPLNRRIFAEDDSRFSVQLDSETLRRALDLFTRRTGVAFSVKWDELAELGIDGDTPTTMRLNNVTLEEALAAMLMESGRLGDLTFAVVDGLIVLRSTEKAKQRVRPRLELDLRSEEAP